jgi:hypothetical protein
LATLSQIRQNAAKAPRKHRHPLVVLSTESAEPIGFEAARVSSRASVRGADNLKTISGASTLNVNVREHIPNQQMPLGRGGGVGA